MTPDRLAQIHQELRAAYNASDRMDPDIVAELLEALTDRPDVTEEDGDKLPWGSVVCSTDTNDYRQLHVRTGQEGSLYWTEVSDAEGQSYPWLFGTERVTLWHYPHERPTQ